MKKLYRPFIKGTNWALAGLLSLLGFSCSDNDSDGMAEYGVPTTTYTIKGKVINEQGEVIPAIQIEVVKYKGDAYEEKEITHSQPNGNFAWQGYLTNFGDDATFDVITTDIDGELNGSYQADTTSVTFKKEELTGADGKWNYGKAEKEITIQLKENDVTDE